MTINLAKPLRWKRANVDEKKMLQDLQGNILKGHGRPHTQNLFLKFDSSRPAEARQFIRELSLLVTPALLQLEQAEVFKRTKRPGSPFVGFFLSASGYKVLGIPRAKWPKDEIFRLGLKKRQFELDDPNPKEWDKPFRSEVDAMILLADISPAAVNDLNVQVTRNMPKAVKVLGVEVGRAVFNENGDGIEHFGYVDGRSQPLLLEEDVDAERDEKDGVTVWDPRFPIDQVLVRDPGVDSPTSFGSYFVFRKLEQNVKEFKDREEKLAGELGLSPDDEELAGALVVGRFEDGTPVALQRHEGMHSPVPNDFNYDSDTDGLKCPFHAHIRKTNPRGETKSKTERSHIMARRGITYGKRRQARSGELEDRPEKDVGLLFMAYQSDIANQFEFTQIKWANNTGFTKPATGLDPIIGQGEKSKQIMQKYQTVWGDRESTTLSADFFGKFVTMKGGEYFFAPCLSFLKNLK